MDQVKAVDLGFGAGTGTDASMVPKRIREELVAGYWVDPEEVFDTRDVPQGDAELVPERADRAARAVPTSENDMTQVQQASGRELLEWATRTRGNLYVFDAPARKSD